MGETKKKQRRAPAPPELYPGHAAELKEKARRDRRIAQANAEPFPGPLDAAFAQGPVQIGGFTVRELVPIDVKLLKRLDSPFYRQMLELLKPKEQRQRTPVADEQEWEIIYLFTRPSLEAEAELDRSLAGFRHAARLAFAHNPRINVAVYQRLYNACANRIIRAFATAVAYEARSLCGDDEVFTTPPPEPTTASVGG